MGALDFDILWILAGVLTAFDIWKLTPFEAGVAAYTYYKLLIDWPRHFLASRNIAWKTLVESRFLM